MIHLQGYIDVSSERMPAILPALKEHITLSRAENGCISFNVTPCPDVAGRFLVDETFSNQATFDAHQARVKASDWGRISAGIPREYTIKEV